MELEKFNHLLKDIRSCTFSSSKKKCIKKTQGVLAAQQVYTLVGQFTSQDDRREVVHELYKAKRLLPMSAVEAAPIVSMGVYSGQKRDILEMLAGCIVDRHDKNARKILKKQFDGVDKTWLERHLDQLGPYVHPQIQYPAGAAPVQYPPGYYPPQQPAAAGAYPQYPPPAGAYPPNSAYPPQSNQQGGSTQFAEQPQYPPSVNASAPPPEHDPGLYPNLPPHQPAGHQPHSEEPPPYAEKA